MPQVRDRDAEKYNISNAKHHDFSAEAELVTDTRNPADGNYYAATSVPFSSIANEAEHVKAGDPQTIRFTGDGYLANPGTLVLGFRRPNAETSTFEISDIHIRAIRYADYTTETIQLPTRPSSDQAAFGPAKNNPSNGTVSVAVKSTQRSALAKLASGPQPQTKARIVLLADRGITVNEIAAETFTSPTFVRRTVGNFKRSGLRAIRR